MKEYAIYPFQTMGISQAHNEGNHVPHWKNSKNYSDKPWDEACKDSGRDYFIPQNDFIIEEVLGINNNITNSVRLKSVNKLYMPYKNEPDYLCLTLTHMNEDNLKQVHKNQILKKGSKILLEGTDGYATGNHFHITANTGKYYGLLKNSNGSWCYTYEKSLLPNEAFYVDTDFTIIRNSKGYTFKNKPDIPKVGTPVLKNELVNQIEILANNLYARKTPNGEILGYVNKGVYDILTVSDKDSYLWYEIEKNVFCAYSSSWAVIYPKKEVEKPAEAEQPIEPSKTPQEEPKHEDNINNQTDTKNESVKPNNTKKHNIFIFILELIKRIFKF